MLTIVCDAYELGTVMGCGAPIKLIDREQWVCPQITVIANENNSIVNAHTIVPIAWGPALAVDIFSPDATHEVRNERLNQFAQAHVIEVWQIDVTQTRPHLYQANAQWQYERILPDTKGIYYSAVAEELAFPIEWFKSQPTMWKMMEWWDMIHS
jgi:hypothetical protein